ncbi:MAG TPA: peroxiredoxin, partial [Planctomycetaceae bacterium]|nr:peroxiredoxin [Planctomycetaceae bacterium]
TAEGDMDFRGTLGVDRETPVGITAIRLHFDIDCDADEESITKLISLTERYCVIYQTLAGGLSITTEYANSGSTS